MSVAPRSSVSESGNGCSPDGVAPMTFDLDAILDELAARVAARLDSATDSPAPSSPWRLLDVDEVAAMLGRSPRSVHTYVKRGLPFIRLDGGALAFDPDDVRAWARARRVPAAEPEPLAERWQGGRQAARRVGSGNGDLTVKQKAGAE